MTILIPISLFGWIPVILLIFSMQPPRRAVLIAFIFAWLFLPLAGYDIPGFPDYTKRSATSLGVFLGMALFHSHLLCALRPRWVDLPVVIYCLCPIASSLYNGLGPYDGFSAALGFFVTWGLPYLIGRVYFTRLEDLRELALALVVGGLIYVPLCAYEMKMSPQLHKMVYGIMPSWGELAYGVYRPQVFMTCALEVALWMTATATTAFWLWASGSVKVLRGYPLGWLVVGLSMTAIMCAVTGAWILMIMGFSFWFLVKRPSARLFAVAFILLPVVYISTRVSGLWTGEQAVNLVRSVLNDRRADSLNFRMTNENMLAARAMEQPLFGWGGWGRAFVVDADGRTTTVVDGMWIIALGNTGLLGLVSFEAILLLPMTLLVRRYPVRTWRTPTLAPAAALATLANLYALDCIANAMVNPIYILVIGGLTGTLDMAARRRTSLHAQPDGAELSELLDHYQSTGSQTILGDSEHLAGSDPRETAAIRFSSLGRSLREHGMVREAEEAWFSALRLWAELAAEYPDDLEYRKCWLDGLNDLAWTLTTHPGLDDRDLARAIQLAEQTVTMEPECATYWNTLGIAYFRARDSKAAIHALEQSADLSDGGTSFDHFFLAMAYRQQGDREQALKWYLRGNAWMGEHSPDHDALLRFRAEAAALLDSRPIPV